MSDFPAAMILAAGRGQRMRPLSETLAKPALPVLGKSILARVLAHLARAGVRDFSVNAFHGAESVRTVLERDMPPGCRGELFVEDELMDTGGALAAPAARLARPAEHFLLHNGDTLLDFPAGELVAAATGPRLLGALLVRPRAVRGYRAIGVRNGRFTGLTPARGDDEATYLGAAVLHGELLDRVAKDRPSSLFSDLLLPMLEEGWSLMTLPYEGPWFEFTSAESYLSRLLTLLDEAGGSYRGPGALVDAGAALEGRVALEGGTRVAGGSTIRDSVLLAGAEVREGARAEHLVLGPGAILGAEASLANGVLTRREDGAMIYSPFEELGRR